MMRYKVEYELHTFEYLQDDITQKTKQKAVAEMDSDNPYYAFVDLTEKHKSDNLSGLKILSITSLLSN